MATLTIGGDDIDFPGILFNCIIESHIPGGGPPFRTCDDQRTHSWSLINDPSLVTNISELIGKIVTKAQQGQAGKDFKLYVTGYGQFFNNETTLCNDVTFARTANPNPDNQPHINMTTELRTEFNEMSLGLNAAIQKAVAQNAQNGVKYIDIDAPLTGHRFCEDGIQEPDQNNVNLWLWHYPYNQPADTEIGTTGPNYTSVLQAANAKAFGNLSTSQLSQQYGSARAADDAFYNAIDWNQVSQLGGVNATGFWDGVVGARAKLFHPQVPWQTWIETTIVNQWKQDRDIDGTGTNPTQTSPSAQPSPSSSPPPPPPYATGTCSFHLTETQICDTSYSNNLFGVVKMYDNAKNVIGQTVTDNDNPIGYAMDAGKSYSFTSKLPNPLVITGEHENDYVQFTIGTLSWQSKTPNGGASCTVGGWDPRDGPVCDLRTGDNTNAVSPSGAVWREPFVNQEHR